MAPRDGETLIDLPMRVIVPERRFNQQKLLWAINLGGCTHIQVFDRTSGGDRLIYRSNSSAVYS
ncbi:hypothetical protein AAFP30_22220 [Gordonia sp. CPCC 205515]|uniref:hypothetical protein n=1 Tax=Gordonia sp. CPCC 205515 TaxID=3140791 RepID=UPI003AF33A1A